MLEQAKEVKAVTSRSEGHQMSVLQRGVGLSEAEQAFGNFLEGLLSGIAGNMNSATAKPIELNRLTAPVEHEVVEFERAPELVASESSDKPELKEEAHVEDSEAKQSAPQDEPKEEVSCEVVARAASEHVSEEKAPVEAAKQVKTAECAEKIAAPVVQQIVQEQVKPEAHKQNQDTQAQVQQQPQVQNAKAGKEVAQAAAPVQAQEAAVEQSVTREVAPVRAKVATDATAEETVAEPILNYIAPVSEETVHSSNEKPQNESQDNKPQLTRGQSIAQFATMFNDSAIRERGVSDFVRSVRLERDVRTEAAQNVTNAGAEKKALSARDAKAAGRLNESQQAKIINKIQEVMDQALKGKSGNTITVRLQPDELGSVLVKVTQRADHLYAKIAPENGDVEKLLQSKVVEMVNTVMGSGFKQENIHIQIVSDQGERELFYWTGAQYQQQYPSAEGGEGSFEKLFGGSIQPSESVVHEQNESEGEVAGWVA